MSMVDDCKEPSIPDSARSGDIGAGGPAPKSGAGESEEPGFAEGPQSETAASRDEEGGRGEDDPGEAPATRGARSRRGGHKARLAELELALRNAGAQSEENYDRWLRARAEFENLRKRTQRDMERVHRRAGEKLVMDLLPVLDDLEKAIEASQASDDLRPMEEGLSLIRKGVLDALARSGVEVLDSVGDVFDPNLHEAVMQDAAAEAAPGTIVRVLQKGYLMNGTALRAAKVIVAGKAAGQEV